MFAVFFKLAFVAGLGLALPVVLVQVRHLLTSDAPRFSLVRRHRRALSISLPLTGLSYYVGLAFAFLVVLPPIIAERFGQLAPHRVANAVDVVRLAVVVLFLVASAFAAPSILLALSRERD